MDQEVEPYDMRMGMPGAVDAAHVAGQLGAEYPALRCVAALLPIAYMGVLRAAVELLDRPLSLLDVFEGCTIGYQRQRASTLAGGR
ncbi:hypothetical protein [Nocardia asiatica]